MSGKWVDIRSWINTRDYHPSIDSEVLIWDGNGYSVGHTWHYSQQGKDVWWIDLPDPPQMEE